MITYEWFACLNVNNSMGESNERGYQHYLVRQHSALTLYTVMLSAGIKCLILP